MLPAASCPCGLGGRRAQTRRNALTADSSNDAPMAFFPGYPATRQGGRARVRRPLPPRWCHRVHPGGIDATHGVARLARNLDAGSRGRHITVAMVAGAPMSVVFGMPYPEALLVALAAWVLVAVIEHRWWWAGAGTAVAGLVSPMAGPLIPVVIAAALLAMYRGRASLAPAFAAILSPLGMIGYLLWVHQRSTTPGGYFGIENRGWDTGWDFGWTTLRFVAKTFAQPTLFFYVATAAIIVASIAAVVVVRRHLPWPVWSYSLLVVALALGSGGFEQDRGRLLLAAFPLAIPAAKALTRMRTRTAMTLTGVVVLAGLWFGAYSLSAWKFGI
jgi:hypothetical protein